MKLSIRKYWSSVNIETLTSFSKDVLKVLIGGTLLGFAYSKLMVPNEIINGGATSLSLILESLTGISVAFYTQVLTALFLFLSLIFFGGKNVVLSVVSSVAYSVSFAMFYNMNFSIQTNLVVDVILAAFIISAGYYFCLSVGASTVGVEVIAMIINKKNPEYDLIKLMRLMNYIVLGFGFLIYGIKSVIIGVLFSYGYSAILNYLLKLKKKGEIA